MAPKAVDLSQIVNDYVDIGFPHVWSFFHEGVEKPNIPEDCLFTLTNVEDVLTTQFFLRCYFKRVFFFTFETEAFKKEVQFLWQTWIENRDNLREKLIDGLAAVMEASLFCSKHKKIDLTLDDAKEILRECFQFEEYKGDMNSEIKKFCETTSDYKILTDYRKEHMEMFENYENPKYDGSLWDEIEKSEVRFPIVNGGYYNRSTVFVRLYNEMKCFRYLYTNKERDAEVFMYYAQDRKYNSAPPRVEFAKPDEITESEEKELDEDSMPTWDFALNVLNLTKISEDTKIYLFSERYGNSLEKMLKKRYSGKPGHYLGISYEVVQAAPTYEQFYVYRSKPTDDANWIEAIDLKMNYYMA